MVFRLDPAKWPNRTKIQFTTAAWMPHLVYQACLAAGIVSNTVYVQHAVCEALARDLGLDLDALLADLPAPRGHSATLNGNSRRLSIVQDQTGGVVRIGPANTVEEVT